VGRRVLVTGLGTFWGGRAAQALEQDDDVDVIVGLDIEEPSVELERTEFVRADEGYSILSRIVKAARIDTILHTFLIVDTTRTAPRAPCRPGRPAPSAPGCASTSPRRCGGGAHARCARSPSARAPT
jgi:hypothetical protein